METINLLESLKTVNVQPVGDILNTASILNPPIAKTKGQTNARLKSNLEKHKRKATKGMNMYSILRVRIHFLTIIFYPCFYQ